MREKLPARIAVNSESQKKISILASKSVRWMGFWQINQLIAHMIAMEWNSALAAGAVTDKMLEPLEVFDPCRED